MKHRTKIWHAAALVVSGLVTPALADTSWTAAPATPGDWFNAANWGNGVPVAGAEAYVDNSGTAQISGSSAQALDLFLGSTGTGHLVQSGGLLTASSVWLGNALGHDGSSYILTGGTVDTSGSNGQMWVGENAKATFNQSGGINQTGILYLGGNTNGIGTYLLGGSGQLTSVNQQIIGDSSTGNIFVQSGGSNITPSLILGNSGGTAGAYQMSAGSLTAGEEDVSYQDPSQSAAGTGVFNQSGGTNSVGFLSVGSLGNYIYTGGSLNVSNGLVVTGTLNFQNASTTLSVANGALVDLSHANILNAKHASFSVGTNSITVVPAGFNGSTAFGSFTTGGILHTLGTTLTLPSGSNYTLAGLLNDHVVLAGTLATVSNDSLGLTSGMQINGGTASISNLVVNDTTSGITTGSLTANGGYSNSGVSLAYPITVGSTGTGLFTQSGGTVTGGLELGQQNGSSGTYVLTGGTLNGSPQIGDYGAGTLNVSGGVVNSYSFGTAESETGSAKILLSGTGAINALRYTDPTESMYSADARLGFYGNTTVNQSGGQMNVQGGLYVGYQYGASAVYTLSAGTVTSEQTYVGYAGNGTFNQTGGTHTIVGSPSYNGNPGDPGLLDLGGQQYAGTANGVYNMIGGNLIAQSMAIGDYAIGTFNQSGGTVSVSGEIDLGKQNANTANGTYILSNGTLTAATEVVSVWSKALFQQTGGTNTVQILTVNSQGQYNLAGGSLIVNGTASVASTINFATKPGSLTIGAGASGFFGQASLLNTSQATFNAGSGSYVEFPAGFNPATAFKSFTSAGTVHIAGTPLTVPSSVTIDGSGNITGNTTNNGNISPGLPGSGSPGIASPLAQPAGAPAVQPTFGNIKVTGTFTQSTGGILSFDLGGTGTSPQQFDTLQVTSSTALNGQLNVALVDGFVPASNLTFPIVKASSITGKFTNAAVEYQIGSSAFDVVYSSNAVTLQNYHTAVLTWNGAARAAASPGDGSGTWSTSSSLWSNQSINTGWTDGCDAVVGSATATAPATITLGNSISADQLTFTNAGTGAAYTVNLGSYSLSSTKDIQISGTPVTFSGGTLSAGSSSTGYTGILLTADTLTLTGGVAFHGGYLKGINSGATVYLKSTTIQPTPSEMYDFFSNISTAYVSSGGFAFDTSVLPAATVSQISEPLLHDPAITGADGGLNKQGAGTLQLGGNNTFTGPMNVSGGTLTLMSGTTNATTAIAVSASATLNAFGGLTGNPSLISNGTTVIASSPAGITIRPIGNLSIGATGQVTLQSSGVLTNRTLLTTTGITFSGSTSAWTGQLDLTGNDLDVSAGSLATTTNQVKQGYAGGHWNGSGILSSTAAGNPTHLTALGVMQNNQSGSALFTASHPFDGFTPGAGDILLKYTYFGDANLDGKVDSSDYTRIDAAFLADRANPAALTGWYNGDFNYDGVINASDYTLIDNAFNTQGARISEEIASPTAQVGLPASATAVPEPMSVGLLVAGGSLLLSRRRRDAGMRKGTVV